MLRHLKPNLQSRVNCTSWSEPNIKLTTALAHRSYGGLSRVVHRWSFEAPQAEYVNCAFIATLRQKSDYICHGPSCPRTSRTTTINSSQVSQNQPQEVDGNATGFVWVLNWNCASHLWYMMTETILSIAERAELSERQHGGFAFDKAAHALGLHHRRYQRVEVVLRGRSGGDVTGACFGAVLSWKGCRTGQLKYPSKEICERYFITRTKRILALELTFCRLLRSVELPNCGLNLPFLLRSLLPSLLLPLHPLQV